jgi:hypothetical protein
MNSIAPSITLILSICSKNNLSFILDNSQDDILIFFNSELITKLSLLP